jgi:hypothetical protein
MALVGGGTLGTRVQLLGEWSDLASLFNACEVVCSSALNDGSRMTLVAAMLCGVPCVATGIGAQGEVIGQYGVAIEAGSTPAFVKGIQRVLALTPEKRAAMAQGARKHALQNYVYVRSLQRYLQLYYDLIGRQSLVSQEMPTPEIDASVPVPAKVGATAQTKKSMVTMADLSDPDSLEAKVVEHDAAALPKWRLEQEQQRAKREEDLTQKIASASQQANSDVLQVFDAELAKPQNKDKALNERARGVADESEELLSMEAIATPTPGAAVRPAPTQPLSVAPVLTLASTQPLSVAPPQNIKLAPTLPLSVAPAPPAPEPASVTQPLAALTLLETPIEPVQLGLLGSPAPERASTPSLDDSGQLQLLPDPVDALKKVVGQLG